MPVPLRLKVHIASGILINACLLLNVAGYYDPLIAMIEHGIEQRFID